MYCMIVWVAMIFGKRMICVMSHHNSSSICAVFYVDTVILVKGLDGIWLSQEFLIPRLFRLPWTAVGAAGTLPCKFKQSIRLQDGLCYHDTTGGLSMQDFLTFVLIFPAAQLIIDRNDVALHFRKGLAVTDDFSRLDSLKHFGIAFQEEILLIGKIAEFLSFEKTEGKQKRTGNVRFGPCRFLW